MLVSNQPDKFNIISVYDKNKAIKVIAETLLDSEFRISSGFGIPNPTPEQRFIFARGLFTNFNTIFFVLAQGKIIGFVILENIDRKNHNATAHIHLWRRTKYMRALSELFIDICNKDYGLDTLLGITPSNNERALKFAHAIGFHEVGRIPHYYRGADGVVTYMAL